PRAVLGSVARPLPPAGDAELPAVAPPPALPGAGPLPGLPVRACAPPARPRLGAQAGESPASSRQQAPPRSPPCGAAALPAPAQVPAARDTSADTHQQLSALPGGGCSTAPGEQAALLPPRSTARGSPCNGQS